MNFGELQTQVLNKIDYNDQSTKVPTYINSAIHILEEEDDWPHMENKANGSLTTSVDYIAIPARYKNSKSLFITNDTKQEQLHIGEYVEIIRDYPYGSNTKGLPKRFAEKYSESNFVVRPYPDKTYAFEMLTNVFSADLLASANSNWWTDNKWEIVLYGALVQFELDSGQQLKLGTEEIPLSPMILYQGMLAVLKRSMKRRKYTKGIAYSKANYIK